MGDVNPETELANTQRDQFAHYIVRMAVAIGIVDGQDKYTGDQVAFLAVTAIDAICRANERKDHTYAAERKKLLDSMPPLRALSEG